MPEIQVRSCGFIIFRITEAGKQFLLMKHSKRWDLPKGHVDPGETEMQCALRELEEETGIHEDDISIDENFRFTQEYEVRYKRNNYHPQWKELVIFLATLNKPIEITLTEHKGYQWIDWSPPHSIQTETIDPLLQKVATHLDNSAPDE